MAPIEPQNGPQRAKKWCPMLFQQFFYQVI